MSISGKHWFKKQICCRITKMDRTLLNALIISLCGHLLLFFPWTSLKRQPSKRAFSEIEISYFQIKPNPPEEIKVTQVITVEKSQKEPPNPEKISLKEEIKIVEKKEELAEPKKAEKKVAPVLTKEEQLVAQDFSALSKEPAFLDYYRAIREKIKISANRNKPAFFSPGEVYIFFVLNRQGDLKRLKIIETRSSSDPILKNTALKSVENASPFPPFPQRLNREQIAFNIIIAFEIK